MSIHILLFSALALLASANPFPGSVADGTISERLPNGGWALISSNSSCPDGSSILENSSPQACCPTAYTAQTQSGASSHVCCPKNTNCLASLQAIPYCANTAWVLWNSTIEAAGNGYFCCQGGETGTNGMTCSTNISSGDEAARLGRPEPSGVTLSTNTPTGAATSGSSGSSTAIVTATSTTVSTSSTSTSTASGSASSTAKSEANAQAFIEFGVFGIALLGCVVVL